MQALSQSSFLQALGYAITNSLWQVALLWLVTLVINACFKLSSHNRYRVAITAQLAGFVWFVVTLQFYYQQCIKATADAQLLLQHNTVIYQPDLINSRFNILSYITKAEMLLPYLSLAYICLLFVLVVRWLRSYRYTSQLKHEGLQKADMDVRLFIQSMSAQLGIKRKVKIYLSSLVTCPLTIGFLKPIILVPIATVNHLTTQQLEAVLLHELAHIRRADYLINLLLNVIETILFFNPFTRLIGKSINKEREHCCDDWVLQFKYNAPMYAEALLRIACLQASPAIAMKAEGRNEGELLWRVKRLLNHQQKRFNYSQQMIALVVTTCMLISIAWLQPVTTAKRVQQAVSNKPMKAVVVAPMAAQINNPFFSPLAFFAKPLKEEVQKATQEIAKADLHKTLNTSIDEAGKALTAVTPTVLNELDKLSVDSNFEAATNNAQKELKKVKWSELKQLSPFVDSAFITNAVSMALDKNKLCVDFEKAKQSIAASKQTMAKLKQQNLQLNQAYINVAIDNATTWLNSNDFIKTWNENVNTVTRKETKEKRRQREQELLQQRLMQSHGTPPVRSFNFSLPEEESDCYRKKEEENAPEAGSADQVANWTYTNPVYIEKATDAANGNNEEEDSVFSFTVQPQQPIAAPSPVPPAKPSTVHVLKLTDNTEHVSIIITIRQ